MNYYNEIDPYCAAWLQNLMDAGHIAPGVIDTRSIEDVRPDELAGYTQCHFFAGIGVWSLALRSAGWPDSRRAWTGSCPCQPFSAAGKGAGFADERHLWPAWQHLIAQCRPPVIFGEQVASKAVEPWIDLVHADLEGMGYAFGGIAFPSAGVGAPHIRDRNFWVADSPNERQHGRRSGEPSHGRNSARFESERFCDVDGMGNPDSKSAGRDAGTAYTAEIEHGPFGGDGDGPWDAGDLLPERVADNQGGGWREECQDAGGQPVGDRSQGWPAGSEHGSSDMPAGPTNSFWRAADWLGCTDGKWRPVEPGTFPLVDGAASRVGRLRAYGNAINAEAAKAFIESYCEARNIESLRNVA